MAREFDELKRMGSLQLPQDEIDRIIGVLYELTERYFPTVVQLAYGKRPRPG